VICSGLAEQFTALLMNNKCEPARGGRSVDRALWREGITTIKSRHTIRYWFDGKGTVRLLYLC
jgi:hypothetical protein